MVDIIILNKALLFLFSFNLTVIGSAAVAMDHYRLISSSSLFIVVSSSAP